MHTTSDRSSLANFRYNTSRAVDDHIDDLRRAVEEAGKYDPLFINSHSGCDSWTIPEARTFLRAAQQIEKDSNITIAHEGHRRRIFWNPFNFRDILQDQDDLTATKITLDISHWVACLERIFDSPESLQENGDIDGWW